MPGRHHRTDEQPTRDPADPSAAGAGDAGPASPAGPGRGSAGRDASGGDMPGRATPDAATHPHEVHSVDSASAVAEVAEELSHAPAPPRRGGLAGLYDRFGHLLAELGKFGTVGLVAFVTDTAIFNVLLARGVESLTGATISMIIAATIAFIGNRFWTWRDRERSGLRREYSLYFAFNAVGLLIALACLAISVYALGAVWPVFKTTLAQIVAKQLVGTALGTAFRFWAYRNIVFRRSS